MGKTISVEEQEKREKEWKEATDGIDWSKLGDNIKSFFGTNEEGKGEDEKTADGYEKDKSEEKKEDKKDDKKNDKKEKDKKDDKKDAKKDAKKEKEKPKEPKKPKVETVKVDLSGEGSRNDVAPLEGS